MYYQELIFKKEIEIKSEKLELQYCQICHFSLFFPLMHRIFEYCAKLHQVIG